MVGFKGGLIDFLALRRTEIVISLAEEAEVRSHSWRHEGSDWK
jgi:hypothetical protein